ncbi:MAG: hypothetical protein AAGJ35_05205 [Myxococcota bacterium]
MKGLEERLRKQGIVRFDKDMRLLGESELRDAFGARKSRRIILKKLMKSVIWQVYERRQEGTEEETAFFGNLRTFWYQYAKPVLSRIPDDDRAKMDPYSVMSRCFHELVMGEQLFQYKDFDFADENWENRRLGTNRPEVLLFAEKTGWFRALRRWNEAWGVSVLALGGFPSALTSEYTAAHLKPVLGDKKLKLLGIVDYDPSGSHIASSFAEQLERCGVEVEEPHTLIHPEHYMPQELEMFSYPLPKRQRRKTANWLDVTGGIDGQALGLESESLPFRRLEGLLKQLIGIDD